MAEYEAASALIRQHRALQSFAGARPVALIEAAERTLGRPFPPTYRRFLAEYGAGGFGSDDFYGVIDEDFEHSSVPDAVWATLTGRRQADMPNDYVEVYSTADGEAFCIDSGTVRDDGESPMIVFHPGDTIEAKAREQIAEDFGSFLLARVQRQISRRTASH